MKGWLDGLLPYTPLVGVIGLALTFGGFFTNHTVWASGVDSRLAAVEDVLADRAPLVPRFLASEQALGDLKRLVAEGFLRSETNQRRLEDKLDRLIERLSQ